MRGILLNSILILSLLISNITYSQIEYFKDLDKLKGPIKSLKISFLESTETAKTTSYKYFEFDNKRKRKIEILFNSMNGDTLAVFDFKYKTDTVFRNVKFSKVKASNSITTYEGIKIKERQFYSSKEIKGGLSIFNYLDNEKTVEIVRFNKIGMKSSMLKHNYDNKGNLIEFINFTSTDNGYSQSERRVFEYNSQNELIKEMRYDFKNRLRSTNLFQYKEHDAIGNWIKREQHSPDGFLYLTEIREFEYY